MDSERKCSVDLYLKNVEFEKVSRIMSIVSDFSDEFSINVEPEHIDKEDSVNIFEGAMGLVENHIDVTRMNIFDFPITPSPDQNEENTHG